MTAVDETTLPLMLAAPVGCANQPVSAVEWVPRSRLSANSWNPNMQAPPEHRLLRVSILESGWTQPIVVREHDGGARLEIVDGYHRWLLDDPEINALTDGLIPIVRLPECSEAQAQMSTVRHNRARGTHHVLGMAAIVDTLLAAGLSKRDIGARLEMDPEEVDRLADRGSMIERGSAAELSRGWTVD